MAKNKINICVLGANGQLGLEFNEVSSFFPNFSFDFLSKADLDISNSEIIKSYFEKNSFKAVINCAAYTNVEKSEDEKELANKINGESISNLINVCNAADILLVHFSTDYVFSGNSNVPYKEDDVVDPINSYGKSKLIGEQLIIESKCEHLIFRTSWLYSSFGNNFVKTMLKLGQQNDSLDIVNDQIGSPTYARDLAFDVLVIMENILLEKNDFNSGIYHYSNEEQTSWDQFAKEIFKIKKIDCKVNPILTKDYPTKAKRPMWSVLDNNKINNEFEVFPSPWKDSLVECLKLLPLNK